MQYPKSVRKELNTLASTAYERELDRALGELYKHFKEWKNKEIDCFDLKQLIHEFHQKKSRELWSSIPQCCKSRGCCRSKVSGGEAVVSYREPPATREMRCHGLS